MAEEDRPDRFAHGTGSADAEEADQETRPGLTGGGRTYLPQSGDENVGGTAASSREGTIGAVGEMDVTGAPAGTSGASGTSAGESEGGGPGGGATSRGGSAASSNKSGGGS